MEKTIMAEAKSRREPVVRTRTRMKSDMPLNGAEDSAVLTEPPPTDHLVTNGDVTFAPVAPSRVPESRPAPPPPPPVVTPPMSTEDGYAVFDEEINSRYEEIKRGSTHISALQQMTMPQLLKVSKDEGITDYTGLKKQDLIFKILKERVKQNGLMFGDGTLEVLPGGFGFLRSPDYNYLPCPDDIYISP